MRVLCDSIRLTRRSLRSRGSEVVPGAQLWSLFDRAIPYLSCLYKLLQRMTAWVINYVIKSVGYILKHSVDNTRPVMFFWGVAGD